MSQIMEQEHKISKYSEQKLSEKILTHFLTMAKTVPAYKSFLKKNHINSEKILNASDINLVPTMTKQNYILKYSINKLCFNGKIEDASYIVSSSGSSGVPFLWPRNETQTHISNLHYQSVFESVFKLQNKKVLLINTYAQGTWIAGTEAFLAAQYLSKKHKLTVVNTGIDMMAGLRQITELYKLYDAVVICGYPPFIKDFADKTNKEIKKIPKDTFFIAAGGESFSESWRDYIAAKLNITKPERSIIGFYGMSDGGGILAYETPQTILIKRKIEQNKDQKLAKLFGDGKAIAIFQYHPSLRFFEVSDRGDLLLTSFSGIPLFRYNTSDMGGLVPWSSATKKASNPDQSALKLPFVYLCGRSDLAATFYALNIYPEHIRNILDHQLGSNLTGIFFMKTKVDKHMNQVLEIELELAEFVKPRRGFSSNISTLIYENLPKYNSEFGELKRKLGVRAKPKVRLKKFGDINYVIGRKHKWVKKD